LLILLAGAATTLCLIALLGAQLDQLFLVTGAGFIALYILGSASAVKLLKIRGLRRIFPYVTIMVSIVVFTFVRQYVVFPLAITALCLLWIRANVRP
jgi:hypothetical protein